MSIGSVKSGIFPTEEMAVSALDGALTDIGKNQQVDVLGISTVEVAGGFMAVATLEITDLEEEEEIQDQHKTEKQERDSNDPEASEGYYISDLSRGSLAQDSIPEGEDNHINDIETPTAEELDNRDGTGDSDSQGSESMTDDVRSSFEESGPETSSDYEDITLPEEDRREASYLSAELRNDFDNAQDDEIAAQAVVLNDLDTQNALATEEEREDIQKRRRALAEQLQATLETPELTE